MIRRPLHVSTMRAFSGAVTALLTPFRGDDVDLESFAGLVTAQIEGGCAALAPCTVFGEGPTLRAAEAGALIRICAEISGGRVPVIAGITCNGTQQGHEAAEQARSAGADAILVATPPYNKPNQEGLLRHLSVLSSAGLPLLVHNSPARSVVDLTAETVRRLAQVEGVIGLVDDGCDGVRLSEFSRAGDGRLAVYAGNDDAPVSAMLAGAHGFLSTAINIAPTACTAIAAACASGEWRTAVERQALLRPIVRALASEPAPAPAKYAVSLLRPGFSPMLRLPMVSVSRATATAVSEALTSCAGSF